MVKSSEIGMLGAALRQSHGLSAESEVLGLSSRVRRAASSLQMQSEETVLASYGPTKTAILTMLVHHRRKGVALLGRVDDEPLELRPVHALVDARAQQAKQLVDLAEAGLDELLQPVDLRDGKTHLERPRRW